MARRGALPAVLPALLALAAGCGSSGGHPDGGQPDSGQPDGGVAALSDPFTGTSLDPSWSVVRPEAVNLSVGGGSLTMTLRQNVLWFDASRGVLVYKLVTGDFSVTTTAHARKASSGQPPDSAIHLGGLMARSPASDSGAENYVFAVVGFGDMGHLTVETKSTTNSASQYQGPNWPSADAELRLCRLGGQFYVYKRSVGATSWTSAASFSRPDLPATLQVGPNLYAPADDLRVSVDGIRFAAVTSAADCTQ